MAGSISEYSIHLSALESNDSTAAIPSGRVERVLSEDIDGPSDFTENLIAYIKGGKISDASNRKPSQASSARDSTVLRHPSKHVPLFTEDEGDISHHTPTNTPPRDSVYEDKAQHDDVTDVSSIWDPFNEGRSHLIVAQARQERAAAEAAQKKLMQPTVEDYYSELSPERITSIRSSQIAAANEYNNSTMSAQVSEKGSRSRTSSPGLPSSPSLSSVHSASLRRAISPSLPPQESQANDVSAALLKELEEMRARCTQLEAQNATLTQSLEEERRAHLEEKNKHAAEVAELKEEMRAHLEETANHDAEVQELQQQINVQKTEMDTYVQATKTMKAGHKKAMKEAENRISETKSSMEASNSELVVALNTALIEKDALEDDLSTTREKLADEKAVSKELEVRISSRIRQREEHWQTRVASLEGAMEEMRKERKVMSHELMRCWGREECGNDGDGPQRYKYMISRESRKERRRNAPVGA